MKHALLALALLLTGCSKKVDPAENRKAFEQIAAIPCPGKFCVWEPGQITIYFDDFNGKKLSVQRVAELPKGPCHWVGQIIAVVDKYYACNSNENGTWIELRYDSWDSYRPL